MKSFLSAYMFRSILPLLTALVCLIVPPPIHLLKFWLLAWGHRQVLEPLGGGGLVRIWSMPHRFVSWSNWSQVVTLFGRLWGLTGRMGHLRLAFEDYSRFHLLIVYFLVCPVRRTCSHPSCCQELRQCAVIVWVLWNDEPNKSLSLFLLAVFKDLTVANVYGI